MSPGPNTNRVRLPVMFFGVPTAYGRRSVYHAYRWRSMREIAPVSLKTVLSRPADHSGCPGGGNQASRRPAREFRRPWIRCGAGSRQSSRRSGKAAGTRSLFRCFVRMAVLLAASMTSEILFAPPAQTCVTRPDVDALVAGRFRRTPLTGDLLHAHAKSNLKLATCVTYANRHRRRVFGRRSPARSRGEALLENLRPPAPQKGFAEKSGGGRGWQQTRSSSRPT